MLDIIKSIIDGDQQFPNIWQTKAIRFDVGVDQQGKSFEKYLDTSYNVEDVKGNPGSRGNFFVTNLRIIWRMTIDHDVNLSIGWDTVTNITVTTLPLGNTSNFKHLLLLKTQNLTQNRYQFKFMGFAKEQQNIFNRLTEYHKQILQTKFYRCINLALKCDPNFEQLEDEEVKFEYPNCNFSEDNRQVMAKIILTDVRFIILKQNEKKMNYSIPWVMMRAIEKFEQDDKQWIRIYVRGSLSGRKLLVSCKRGGDLKKLGIQLKTFSETYNKSPILGFKVEKKSKRLDEIYKPPVQEIEEFENTKVRIRRKNNDAYKSNQGFGMLGDAEYNEELGLMVERMPEGMCRADLWEILRN